MQQEPCSFATGALTQHSAELADPCSRQADCHLSVQVTIPLGTTASRRAGKHPKEDEKAWPPGGEVLITMTGEQVCVRKRPDLAALEKELKRLREVRTLCSVCLCVCKQQHSEAEVCVSLEKVGCLAALETELKRLCEVRALRVCVCVCVCVPCCASSARWSGQTASR